MCRHGAAYPVTTSRTGPTRSSAPGTTSAQARPETVRFSPVLPARTGCPSAASASSTSAA